MTLTRELRHPYHRMRAHVVEGPEGVVTLSWFFEPNAKDVGRLTDLLAFDGSYYASDLGIHWRSPLYEWSSAEPDNDFCEYTDGPCWYDGSSLNAERVGRLYLALGEDAVYDELEAWYRSRTKEND